jgi:hypothetical protein
MPDKENFRKKIKNFVFIREGEGAFPSREVRLWWSFFPFSPILPYNIFFQIDIDNEEAKEYR